MASSVAAVVVAAGRGVRAGGESPKQYRDIAGEPVLRRSLLLFAQDPRIGAVQPVIHPEDNALFERAAERVPVLPPVHGGATRQASVRAGLEALASNGPDVVLVHDAARPFASPALVARAIDGLANADGAVPGIPLSDTVKAVDAQGNVVETLDRARLRIVQTPQAFRYRALLDAHRRAAEQGRHGFSDDAALAEWAGLKVSVFEGEPGNIKLTRAEDFARVESVNVPTDQRTGTGFDVHAFVQGDHGM